MIYNVNVYSNLGHMLNNGTKLNMKKIHADLYYTTKYSSIHICM